jgi:predicted lipoprotein with Yx(FWY)xxD motif
MLVLPVTAQDAVVSLGSTETLGDVMVGPDGMTLYMFTRDPLGETVCYDQCAENWPPLIVESADALTVAEGIPGEFTTVERTDGTLQVAVNGMPLYYWARDEAPGDTTGNGVGHVWYVLPPATAYAFRHGDTPPYLVDSNGMTLYIFTNDTEGASTCYDDCATNWPALTVESADDLVSGVNLPGEWGTTERTDGMLQVTYNGMPLYYFAQDMARGDTNGEGRGDVWYTVAPETVGVASSEELGDYLVAPNGMTLYLFNNDAEGVSNCVDQCAENWPPFTVIGADPLVTGPAAMGELGTITRADDSVQVTYNGMPLYFFAEDAAPGDTTGQGRGDVWWVVAP